MTQPQNDPGLPPEQKFLQRSIQSLVRWSPLGGSSFAFASFLLKEDWSTALSLFPITAISGIWAAYSQGFIEQLTEHYGEKGKQDAKDLIATMDQANQALTATLNSVDDRYCQAQADACTLYKTEGIGNISGLMTPLLQEVFVRLKFSPLLCSPGFQKKNFLEDQFAQDFPNTLDMDWDIWDVLAQAKKSPLYQRVVILAWGGFGKTTLLRHVAYRLGTKQPLKKVEQLIPVLLLFRKYRSLLTQDTPPDLPTLIQEHHLRDLLANQSLEITTNWAQNLLKKGKILVMLDGFDEIPKADRPKVARWLNSQQQTYPKSIFIITSRPKAYTEQSLIESDRLNFPSVFHLEPFNAEQRQEFINKWYWCQEYYSHGQQDTIPVRQEAEKNAKNLLTQINDREELTQLASNPLLLTMIAQFHRRYPGAQLPKRRVELYEEICLLQLRDRPGARELDCVLVDCEAIVILQRLALEMMQKKEERLDKDLLLSRLETYLTEENEPIDPLEFLQAVEQVSELLVQREADEYEFSHLSFQEFLAAQEVVRLTQTHPDQEEILRCHFDNGLDWWKATMVFYVGSVKKPSSFIRAALAVGATDLAYLCTQETSKRIDDDLKKDLEELKSLQSAFKAVEDYRYEALETFLKNQQWKEADYETYRLMITTVGKEEGQWFEPEELLNFPCEELLTIDRLWVTASQGRYGFSVQKEIYVRCGAKLDGEYPGDEIWIKFGTEVGWRVNNSWVDYDELTWNSTHVRRGHLPVLCLWGLVFWGLSLGVVRVGGLFSRIKTCKV